MVQANIADKDDKFLNLLEAPELNSSPAYGKSQSQQV